MEQSQCIADAIEETIEALHYFREVWSIQELDCPLQKVLVEENKVDSHSVVQPIDDSENFEISRSEDAQASVLLLAPVSLIYYWMPVS